MHTDARDLDNNSVIEGDICIIGAGAAGISMAMEWNHSKHKVILLEGGDVRGLIRLGPIEGLRR